MVKSLLVILLLTLLASKADAQYRTYKKLYDVKEYHYQKTDLYSPTTAAFLSIIPGLGHCYAGEPLRGAGIFGLTYGSLVLTVYGISQAYGPGDKEEVSWLVGGGTAMFIGSYIWSIADVTRVAKIKNMAWRDRKMTTSLYPSIQTFCNESMPVTSIHGATLTINF